jgi:hypothetical protein
MLYGLVTGKLGLQEMCLNIVDTGKFVGYKTIFTQVMCWGEEQQEKETVDQGQYCALAAFAYW